MKAETMPNKYRTWLKSIARSLPEMEQLFADAHDPDKANLANSKALVYQEQLSEILEDGSPHEQQQSLDYYGRTIALLGYHPFFCAVACPQAAKVDYLDDS